MHKRSLVMILGALAVVGGCSKHDCKLEGKQEHYWKELADTTEGAEKCLASVNPYGCDLEGDRCTPTLNAVHKGKTQEETEKHYRAAFEQQGWKYVGEKLADDKSKSMAFKKGDDELVVAFGTSTLSNAFAGEDGVDVFMMRKPEKATGTMLDQYEPK
jgi:hypothetical protein